MTTGEAAAYAGGLSMAFLAKLRMEENRRRGPAFVKLGRTVLYRKIDLDRWIGSFVVGAE